MIELDAHFVDAGINPRSKAAARIAWTDFGILYGFGDGGEQADLRITAGFEKAG